MTLLTKSLNFDFLSQSDSNKDSSLKKSFNQINKICIIDFRLSDFWSLQNFVSMKVIRSYIYAVRFCINVILFYSLMHMHSTYLKLVSLHPPVQYQQPNLHTTSKDIPTSFPQQYPLTKTNSKRQQIFNSHRIHQLQQTLNRSFLIKTCNSI